MKRYNEECLKESSLSRVFLQMQKHESALLTAFRYARDCGNGKKFTKKENKQRNVNLESKLMNERFGITAVKGVFIEDEFSDMPKEVAEDVFFVVNLNGDPNFKKKIIKFGAVFEQDSILYVNKGGEDGESISTNKCPLARPGKGKIGITEKLKNPVFGKKGKLFTKVGGRPFIFKEDIQLTEVVLPQEFMGRHSCQVASNKHWTEELV